MKGVLPHYFNYKSAKDLVRIGKEYDGGYLVSHADILKTDFLIGLGIKTDWSFESDFRKIKDVEVMAFDGSVFPKHWLRSAIKSSLLFRIRQAYKLFKLYGDFQKFFGSKGIKFINLFVGNDSLSKNRYKSLDEIFKEVGNDRIYLKIDIEGSEYRLLNTIVKYQNKITGIVMEFHDCDLHQNKIKKFIDELDLNLVHIHANNWGPLELDTYFPTVLELTFSKFGEISDSAYLPHELDMPNNKNLSEINLAIED